MADVIRTKLLFDAVFSEAKGGRPDRCVENERVQLVVLRQEALASLTAVRID